jgi:hypothetical protein
MSEISRQVGEWVQRAVDWFRQAEGWQIALLVVAAVIVLPVMPLVLTLALLAALVMFARAWVREFAYLMRLKDDAFPGHNDKMIWAMLLIVLPPVGAWLFQNYREAHWPEVKPGKADLFDY